jgi:uncharacterized protein YjbJ (UPF0337 family)
MHWTQIEEGWSQVMGQAALKWERLTTDDLAHVSGKRTHLISRVHLRYGFTALDVEQQVERWARALSAEESSLRRAS